MGRLIPFQHPGNYRLIAIEQDLYRFPKGQPIPKEAILLEDDIMDVPGLWAHPRYNERAKKVITKRGHDNP